MMHPTKHVIQPYSGGLVLALLLAFFAAPLAAQRPLVDVQNYDIDVKVDMAAQSIDATAVVTFIPRETIDEVIFELNNSLNVSRVVTEDGLELAPVRFRQDYTIRVGLREDAPANEEMTLIFEYDGQLVGYEESPVEGITLAEIYPDRAYLLYPGRWFPVNGYGADQFSANINTTVPLGFKVLGSGFSTNADAESGVTFSHQFNQQSFPGSIAVVRGDPVQSTYSGTRTNVYFGPEAETAAQEYADQTGPIVEYFSDSFGAPYSSSLTLVEVGEYGPYNYAAPGLLFFSPYGRGETVNVERLAETIARQWWGLMVTPGNRSHIWLDHGLAKYSALLFLNEQDGEDAFLEGVDRMRIEALTYDEVPLLDAGRLTPFSAERYALADAKGGMVLHMLRWNIKDEPFFQVLGQFAQEYAWKSVTTDMFREFCEKASDVNLQPFFIQWTENTGTPEFRQEYTVYRLGGGDGFRIIGKVQNDMDTFRMPVELKVETEGEPEFQVVDVIGTSSDYTIQSFGKPVRVVLDPNNRILRYDEQIRVQVAIRKGEQLVELGYYNEALQEYQKALDINRYSSLAHYNIGTVFFLQNNYQTAANEFREAINGDRRPEWTEVWSHINLGKIFDITNQRERAVNEYQLAIRTRDDTQGAQDEARKYLEEPYRRPKRTERIY